MSKLSSFVRKYAGELKSIAGLMGSIIGGIALDPSERAQANKTLAALEGAYESIMGSIKELEKAGNIKISKADIKAAVEALLPDMLESLIAKGVEKALEQLTKTSK